MSLWGPTSTDDYDARWQALEAAGHDPHGEANLVAALRPTSVLDAGCGTGRVGIELARRGMEVVGVDLDATMLAAARAKAPALPWVLGDLAEIALDRRFDVVVLAGNVVIFLEPDRRAGAVANLARHLAPGGVLVAGFQLTASPPADVSLSSYDRWCADAGLALEARYSTWEAAPYDGGPYAVSVHRAPG